MTAGYWPEGCNAWGGGKGGRGPRRARCDGAAVEGKRGNQALRQQKTGRGSAAAGPVPLHQPSERQVVQLCSIALENTLAYVVVITP